MNTAANRTPVARLNKSIQLEVTYYHCPVCNQGYRIPAKASACCKPLPDFDEYECDINPTVAALAEPVKRVNLIDIKKRLQTQFFLNNYRGNNV